MLIECMYNICPGCGKKFQCLGTEECWCHKIKLSDVTRKELRSSCSDCFCEKCLLSKSIEIDK